MTMSQTHKSTIYMKYFKLLLLFLFISVQNATATYVEYKYSDEEISKNEKGISLILLFTDLDDNMKAIESGGIRVRFWNDPACTQPIKDTGYQYTEMHNFATSYTIDMSSIPFQENMLARYGNNYIGPMQVFFTIEILEEARLNDTRKGIVINGIKYVVVNTFKPKKKNDMTYTLTFDYHYILPMVSEDGASSIKVSFPSYRYTKDHPVTELSDFKVVVSFWKDTYRKDPVTFYTSSMRKTTYDNDEVFTIVPDEEDLKKGETFFSTNELERVRHDWDPFSISDLPAWFLNKVGMPELKPGELYSDTIYMYADVYSMEGKLLNKGKYWGAHSRKTIGGACIHKFKSTRGTKTEIEKIDNGCRLKEKKILVYDTTCKKCGRNIHREFTYSTRKYRNPDAPEWCKTNVNDKEEEKDDKKDEEKDEKKDYDENEGNDNENLDNLFISYEMERKESALPSIEGINRKKVEKTVYKVNLENDSREPVGSYTEAEWDATPPCPPHDMEKNGGTMLKCKKCGIVTYDDAPAFLEDLPADQCESKVTFDINGADLVMRLFKGDDKNSPLYVAETETTQGLWTAVYPDNWYLWQKSSQFPATNIPYEDVLCFIDVLNHMAEEKKWPVEFMLPTIADWLYAYMSGGRAKEGWTADNSYNMLHPVRGFKPSENGIYDMTGSALEMTAEYRKADKKEYDDPYDIREMLQAEMEMAVCGNGILDATGKVDPTTERWVGMGPSIDYGFRIFARPVKR